VLDGKGSLCEIETRWSTRDLFRYALAVEIQAQAVHYLDEVTKPGGV